MAVITITSANFEQEVLNSDKTVLIDLWASWCGPSKMLSPEVDEIAEEVSDAKICKINVDDEPDLASRFQVMSIPTLVVIQNGAEVRRSVGVQPKDAILGMIGK